MVLVHVEEARLEVSGELSLALIGLNVTHLLHLFLLGGALNLVPSEPLPKLLDLLILQLRLRLLPALVVLVLHYVLLPQPVRCHLVRIHMPCHVPGVLTRGRLAIILILVVFVLTTVFSTIHLLVLVLIL
jgi:hypothetical protein